MSEILQAIATGLGLVNPAICVSLFTKSQAGLSASRQTRAASTACLAIASILALSAFFGAKVLAIFGVSLDAFSVAGGLVLAWMGFAMLSKQTTKPDAHDGPSSDHSLTPLILFAASPGTITGVITLSVAHSGSALPVTALIAVAVACAVTWVLMMIAIRAGSKKDSDKPSFVKDTVSRFMGLIVLAMGIQFLLSGLQGFFS